MSDCRDIILQTGADDVVTPLSHLLQRLTCNLVSIRTLTHTTWPCTHVTV